MGWTQLYVKAPPGNGYTTPSAMKRIDDRLMAVSPASFCAPTGLPVQEPDGTWEVRVYDSTFTRLVEAILVGEYGLVVERKKENE